MNIQAYFFLKRSLIVISCLSVLFTLNISHLKADDSGSDREHRNDSNNQVTIKPADDVNPDPNIVEVHLTAAETTIKTARGMKTKAWAYNGQVPGPLIEANVGDTLIVHLTNNLPEGTSIHWHGVELPAEMDGSHLSQLEVPPGETYTYKYKVLNPATHWYHPHFRTNEQIDLGLAGPLILRDPAEDAALAEAGIDRTNELTLMLDDMLLDDKTNQPVAFASAQLELDPAERMLSPEEIALQIMNGREGNILLTNGKQTPSLKVRNGVAQRWRIVNVANGRFMRVSIPGHKMYRIGGDGGLLKEAIEIEPIELVSDPDDPGNLISDPDPSKGLLLAPSERADIVFVPHKADEKSVFLEWHDYKRGRHDFGTDENGFITGLGDDEQDGKKPAIKMMRIKILEGPSSQNVMNNMPSDFHLPSPLPRSEHSPLVDIRGEVDLQNSGEGIPNNTGKALPVFFGHMQPEADGAVTFFSAVENRDGLLDAIRAKTADAENAAGAEIPGMVGPPPFMPRPFAVVNNDVALPAKIGDVLFWDAVNFTGAEHPLHAHGFFFQPIETLVVHLGDAENGIPSSIKRITYPLEYKDSIRLPARTGALGRSWTITRLAVRFDDSHRMTSPFDLIRTNEQLAAFGGMPGGTGTGTGSIGDSGGWLFHCHINEHSDQGMMSYYNLTQP
jgi:FtsP/CotA-like multicopper oxidase with cupredoxin domain